MLAHRSPGQIWVDDPANPRSALAISGRRYHVVGAEDNPDFNASLRAMFYDDIYPRSQAAGQVEFLLIYPTPRWGQVLSELMAEKHLISNKRQYYRLRASPPAGWQERIPPGFRVQRIDTQLFNEPQLTHLDEVRKEMTSETPSQEYFLANRFGFCLRDETRIAGWCMSEYNTADRIEIGIDTVPEFRRRGVAQVTASALIEFAYAIGVKEIGWDCWTVNTASVRTALRLGFTKHCDYPVLSAWFDEAANLAVNGNMCFHDGRCTEARGWYEQAFATGRAPLWAYGMAAFNSNRMADPASAFNYLETALEKGFDGWDWVVSSEDLLDLHETERWQALLAHIAQRGS